MMIFKIIQLVFLLFVLCVMIGVVYKFIKENRKHSNRMGKLDQWSQFHGQLMNWSKEIVDVNVRVNFINHCVHKLIQTGNDKLANNDLLDDWSIEEEKQKVCKEWGQHIPSLLQEMRDNKLKQIL
jgi:hypothetical protein